MIWPEVIYSFTKPGKAIVTWKFVMKNEDGRAEYYSNYHQHNWISQYELDNHYYTDERDCRIALIDQINQWKYKLEHTYVSMCSLLYIPIDTVSFYSYFMLN